MVTFLECVSAEVGMLVLECAEILLPTMFPLWPHEGASVGVTRHLRVCVGSWALAVFYVLVTVLSASIPLAVVG